MRRTDPERADVWGIGTRAVDRVRPRFVAEGRESALVLRPRPRGASTLTPHVQAPLRARAQSDPPSGRKRWTPRRITDRLVASGRGAVVCEAVRQV